MLVFCPLLIVDVASNELLGDRVRFDVFDVSFLFFGIFEDASFVAVVGCVFVLVLIEGVVVLCVGGGSDDVRSCCRLANIALTEFSSSLNELESLS